MNMYKNICISYTHTWLQNNYRRGRKPCGNSEKKINYIRTEEKKKDYFLYGCTPAWKQRTKEIAPEQDRW